VLVLFAKATKTWKTLNQQQLVLDGLVWSGFWALEPSNRDQDLLVFLKKNWTEPLLTGSDHLVLVIVG
jgi:hypothetical protein